MSIEVSREFHQLSQEANRQALTVFTLDSGYGRYVFYANPLPDELLGMLDAHLADGTHLADGQSLAGGDTYQVLGHGPLVERFGSLRESLSPIGDDLISGLKQDEVGSLSLRLNERDGLLARLESGPGLLWSLGQVLVGYVGLKPREFASRFQGRVVSYQLNRQGMVLKLRAV